MSTEEREQLDCINSKNADGLVSNTFHLNRVDKKELCLFLHLCVFTGDLYTLVYFAYIKSRLQPSGAS